MAEVETIEKSKEQIAAELTNKEQHLSNLNRELELAQDQVKDIDKRLSILLRERELIIANHRIVIDKFVLLKKTWGFEEDPEYMDNTKKLNIISMEKKLIEFDTQETQLKNLIKQVNTQIESLSKEKDRVSQDISKLKGD